MSDNLDYKHYTLDDLYQAQASVNREQYPNNAAKIDYYIKLRKGEISEQEPLPEIIEKPVEEKVVRPPKEAPPVEPKRPKTPYAGFSYRLAANFIDGLVLIPVIILYFVLSSISYELAIVGTIPYMLGYSLYAMYFHGRWGQTIGKKATKIKVMQINGFQANYFVAFKRHVVDLGFAVISMIAWIIALTAISEGSFDAAQWSEKFKLARSAYPAWASTIGTIGTVWLWSELVVLLFNKKRRAIHDYIAGSVVIHNDFEEEWVKQTQAEQLQKDVS